MGIVREGTTREHAGKTQEQTWVETVRCAETVRYAARHITAVRCRVAK